MENLESQLREELSFIAHFALRRISVSVEKRTRIYIKIFRENRSQNKTKRTVARLSTRPNKGIEVEEYSYKGLLTNVWKI